MNEDQRAAHYVCDICGKVLEEQDRFVVTIVVTASAGPLVISEEDLAKDHKEEMRRLLARMEEMETTELEDEVYRRFRFDLCGACRKDYLRDPLQATCRR